jgi:uncharacterized protein
VFLIILGLAGAVVPALPGAPLIFVGALLWSYMDGFVRVSGWTLGLLGVMTLASMGIDYAMTALVVRKSGASWKTVFAAIGGGLLGGAVGSGALPIIGTLIGAASGAAAGVIGMEYYVRRDWPPALRTARNYCLGSLASMAINFCICATMTLIFWLAARS